MCVFDQAHHHRRAAGHRKANTARERKNNKKTITHPLTHFSTSPPKALYNVDI
jgi:hypothetical protein